MPRKSYSDETKAAVMAALLQGQGLTAVAEEYKIPKSTVANWAVEAKAGASVPHEKKREIGDLVVEVLREGLASMRSQVRVMGEDTYVRKQDADKAAVMFGVISDKMIRLLEALGPSGAPDA